MKINLMPSKDFANMLGNVSDKRYRELRINYEKFLDKWINLGHFIPTDENYIKLHKLQNLEGHFNEVKNVVEQYATAQERVLFKNFTHSEHFDKYKHSFFVKKDEHSIPTIIDFYEAKIVDYELSKWELSETALKEIGIYFDENNITAGMKVRLISGLVYTVEKTYWIGDNLMVESKEGYGASNIDLIIEVL